MYYKKKGKPNSGEIVLCTVKKISFHSVFVILDEYRNVEGMVHISEIAPGRIRNLRDYVKEGKRIVCKVLNIHERTGNIDLSLRRVGTSFMVQKLNAYKQEGKAEKLLELVGKGLNLGLRDMYAKVGFAAVEKYGSLYGFFQEVVGGGKKVLEDLKSPKNITDALYEQVVDKIKPVEHVIEGILKIITYDPDGVSIIKKALKAVEKGGVTVTYLGAPKYNVSVSSVDKKEADMILIDAVEKGIDIVSKTGSGEFNKSA